MSQRTNHSKKLLLTAVLVTLNWLWANPTSAQALRDLHQFTPLNSTLANSDGAFPAAGLLVSSNTLYGTTSQGGAEGGGTVFKVNTDGTRFVVLHSFTPGNPGMGIPSDGAFPLGKLALSGTTLYGTTSAGGSTGNGTIFKVNTDGTRFATLHEFAASDPNTGTNSEGASPWGGLVLSGGSLFGTASRGGNAGSGAIFKINTDGTSFVRLHSFAAVDTNTLANGDGAYPLASLVIASNTLYGTAYRGGSLGTGSVFKINVDGSSFATLHNAEGGPRGELALAGAALYGTMESAGIGQGTIFKLNVDGTGFTNLYNFSDSTVMGPWAGVILSGNSLFGTTYGGGTLGQGSVFELNTDGTGFIDLYSFTGGMDGGQPQAALTLSGGILYGSASVGGAAGDGVVFGVSVGPGSAQLAIVLSGVNVLLQWPANTGLVLQSTTNLVRPVVWTAVSTAPTLVNGQNRLTNAISSAQRYFRLGQ